MTTQSNAVPESFESHGATSAVASPRRPLYWSVRRELWEYRSIYIAPLAVASLYLLGFLVGMVHMPAGMRFAFTFHANHHGETMDPYTVAALLIMATTFVVAVFYCLDALHGERRDRSVLFWKSLPVSDLTTVLSKASIPLVVLPLLTFAITVMTQLIMLLISSTFLPGSGLTAAGLWSQVSLFQMSGVLLFHLLGIHALWYAPIYGWLLLVSGWARRAPFLWAVLPPFAIGVVEKIAFNSSHFFEMLGSRFKAPEVVASADPSSMPMQPLTAAAVGQFLGNPGLWIGLAIFAAFLVAAVRLRRSQGPI